VGGHVVTLELADSGGAEDFDRVRPLGYPNSDVCLICFSVCNPDTVEYIDSKWLAEVDHFAPGIPIILVGCQIDERENPAILSDLAAINMVPFSLEDGKKNAKKFGAEMYLECSSRTQKGLKEVLQMAVLSAKHSGRKLVSDPTVSMKESTPLYTACENGDVDMVSLLLADPNIEGDLFRWKGLAPLAIACEKGHLDIVELLLPDPRIDLFWTIDESTSPLARACKNGHLLVVQHLLISGGGLSTEASWKCESPANVAREAARLPKRKGEKNDDLERRRKQCPIIAELIDEYNENPEKTRLALREDFGHKGRRPFLLFS